MEKERRLNLKARKFRERWLKELGFKAFLERKKWLHKKYLASKIKERHDMRTMLKVFTKIKKINKAEKVWIKKVR